jgi:hypothetical protein
VSVVLRCQSGTETRANHNLASFTCWATPAVQQLDETLGFFGASVGPLAVDIMWAVDRAHNQLWRASSIKGER